MKRQHVSYIIFVLCVVEALFWVNCAVASTPAEVEEYLLRENENLKAPTIQQDNLNNNDGKPNVVDTNEVESKVSGNMIGQNI